MFLFLAAARVFFGPTMCFYLLPHHVFMFWAQARIFLKKNKCIENHLYLIVPLYLQKNKTGVNSIEILFIICFFQNMFRDAAF